jgi:hypothetical protein
VPIRIISGFPRQVAVECVLLGYYAASSGNYSETSVRNYHYSLRNNPEERSSQGQIPSVRAADHWAEMQTRDLPNKKQYYTQDCPT